MSLESAYPRRRLLVRLSRCGRAVTVGIVAATLAASGPVALAQTPEAAIPAEAKDKMLLQADELLYDFDGETVTARGKVQIYYGAYVLDADQVVYDQKSGRLVATGGVRMIEPDGNIVTTEKLDVTDDFRDGFVDSLNVLTSDDGRFAAQSAERRDGNLMIFRKGVYTACKPCLEHPNRPPLWQIKATKITHDKAKQAVYYRNAWLQFYGLPVAYLPFFYHPDPTVKRKTGFLTPSILESDAIGTGVTTPFFWNLAPNYDVTFSPTILTKQGLLMQTTWRHRLMHGSYDIRLAGIFQQDKDAFVDNGERLSGYRDFRGSVRTTGSFSLSDQWSFGWDINSTSDRTFNRDYSISGATAKDLTSTVYLTGSSERNYFDARGYYLLVQREDTEEDLPDDGNPNTPDIYKHDDQAEQAIVHPVIDSNYIIGDPVLGGELRLDSNFASLTREKSDLRHPPFPYSPHYAGVAGTFTRATSRATWKRRFVLPGGQLLTPFTYLQSDASWISSDEPAAGLVDNGFVGRTMPAVGIDYEWPFLATIGSTVHTFGPRVQLIARPNETDAGRLPNEDSQSLVFDDTNLFVYDKFAGYDRQEGGTRANVGFLYQGLFPNGASIDGLIGQSFQLAGENSFALQDHALTGLGSGLETDRSDVITRLTVNTGNGLAFTGRARFDDYDLSINRGEVSAVGAWGKSSGSVGYTYFRKSPSAGIFDAREELNAAASFGIVDNWSLVGSLVYDLHSDSWVSQTLGIAFQNECFDISAVYSQTTDAYTDLVSDRQVYLKFNLKTLGGSSFSRSLPTDTEEQ